MHYIFDVILTDEVMNYIFGIIFIDLFRLKDLLETYDFGIMFIDLFRFRDLLKIYYFEELLWSMSVYFLIILININNVCAVFVP